MVNRIVIPTEDQEGFRASLAKHFRRAPYYTVVDFDDNDEISNVKTVQNTSEHAGGMGYAHDRILALKPNAIIDYGMGPRGLNTFPTAGVAVLRAGANTVWEVIAAYKDNKLQELTEGCEHAHRH